ncbi:MAG: hypothetical protein ABI668_14500 [Sphingorhabdus sp.]
MAACSKAALLLTHQWHPLPRHTANETHEARSFELPGSVWAAMFASYAVFFAALMIATGRDGSAVFAIVVSILYAVMYFGTAAILNSVDHSARPKLSPLHRGKGIETATGWLSNPSANAQILTVPILFAVFACAIAVIRSFV